MCGIVGFLTENDSESDYSFGTDYQEEYAGYMDEYLEPDQGKFIKDLLYINGLRGLHGTGVIMVKGKGKPKIHKKSEDVTQALKGWQYQALSDARIEETSVFIGHNRKATRGTYTFKDTHPFKHEHLSLVHNGTVLSGRGLKDFSTFECDSESVAYTLSLCKNKEEIIEVLSNIDGTYALVWYDNIQKTTYIARNTRRTLFFGTDEDRGIKFFASEAGMMRLANERQTTRYGLKIEPVEPYTLMAFKNGEITSTNTTYTPKPLVYPGSKWITKASTKAKTESSTKPTVKAPAKPTERVVSYSKLENKITTNTIVKLTNAIEMNDIFLLEGIKTNNPETPDEYFGVKLRTKKDVDRYIGKQVECKMLYKSNIFTGKGKAQYNHCEILRICN